MDGSIPSAKASVAGEPEGSTESVTNLTPDVEARTARDDRILSRDVTLENVAKVLTNQKI